MYRSSSSAAWATGSRFLEGVGGSPRRIVRPPYHGNGCLVRDNPSTPNTDTNNGRAYEYRNPGEDALRALIGSAQRSIFVSQQDLLSCAPFVGGVRLNVEARFDERVLGALGERSPIRYRSRSSSPTRVQQVATATDTRSKIWAGS